jgi:hypothetical protein
LDVWNSDNEPGWKLGFSGQPRGSRYTITAAARSKDAAQSPGGDEADDSNWYLTQIFAQHQSSLIARWAVNCLLSFYTDRLATGIHSPANHEAELRPASVCVACAQP